MLPALLRFAAAILAVAALALPARATSYSIDFTDLWLNAPAGSEDGWGLNVIQQDDVLFLTFFVYGPDGTARWYVASGAEPTNPQPANAYRFSGTLYETTGPWFGGVFNPANVTLTVVGTAMVTFDSPSTGTLSYNVGGTSVVKAISRYYFRQNSVGGSYAGGMVAMASACGSASDNGPTDILGTTVVTQTATQATFRVSFTAATGQASTCTFVGDYSQQGRLASVTSGTFSCIVGGQSANTGTFTMTSLDSQLNGFHASFTGRDQFCTYNGRFGGTRDVTG